MEEVCVPVETKDIRRSGKSRKMTGILIGSLIGAGIALLSAPYSGQETRERLRGKSIEIKEKVITNAQETGERVKTMAQRGSERVGEMKTRGQDILSEQKVNLQSAVEGIRTGVRTYKEEGGLPQIDSPEDIGLSTNVMSTEITGSEIDEGAVT